MTRRQDLRNRAPSFTYSRGYTPPPYRKASGWAWAAISLVRVLLALTGLAIGYAAMGAVAWGWLAAYTH